MRIRLATLRDVPLLVRQRRLMFKDVGRRPAPTDADDRRYRAWLRARLRNVRFVAFVAEDRGRVVAGGGVWLQEVRPRPGWPQDDHPILLWMYTGPSYRGKGLASRIVRAAMRGGARVPADVPPRLAIRPARLSEVRRGTHLGNEDRAPVIRAAGPADAAGVRAIYAPYVESSPATFETEIPTEADFRARIERSVLWLAGEMDGRIAGYAYASKHRERVAYQWSVECSVYIHREFHRRGLARGLYGRLFEGLRARGYVNVYAGITLPNPASVGLHESFGFAPVGVYRHIGYKLGAWHDVGWWSLRLVELPRNPAPPRN